MTVLTRIPRVLLNGASVFGGEVIARLATSLMALVIARFYGSVALGNYGYALAVASVLAMVPDFGLHLFAVRELSAEPRRLPQIFWGIHRLKLGLAVAVVVLTLFAGEWGMADSERRVLLYVLVARSLLQTFSQATMSVFKAFEHMEYIAFQQSINSLIVLVWAGAALALHSTVTVVVAGLVAGQLMETLLGWVILRRKFSPGRVVRWDGRLLSWISAGCIPIGVTAILLALNLRIDMLILGIYAPSQVLGQFQAAAWFLTGTFLAASLLMAVLFPRLSRLLLERSAQGSSYVLSLLKNGLLITALGSLVIWLSAPTLLPVLFGPEFAPGVKTLRILAPALPLVFLNTVLFHVFVAARRRFVYVGTLLVGVGTGAALCLYLAPRLGPTGGAIADVVRELVVTGIYLCFLIQGNHARIAGLALMKVLVSATAVLLVGVLVNSPFLSDLCQAAWMIVVVAGTLSLLGVPRLREWRLITDDPR